MQLDGFVRGFLTFNITWAHLNSHFTMLKRKIAFNRQNFHCVLFSLLVSLPSLYSGLIFQDLLQSFALLERSYSGTFCPLLTNNQRMFIQQYPPLWPSCAIEASEILE